ncbi:MAG: PKD domain-containing protein [bacterium]
MKWFNKNHSYVLVVAVFAVAVAYFGVTQKAFANYNYTNNNRYNYNNDGYNHLHNNYPPNYNYNQQYYLSPYITSTAPYPIYQYQLNPYYPNYYNYNNSSFSVSCAVSNLYSAQGQSVTWSAYVYGGGGGGYSYLWNGTDNPLSLNSSSINVTYGSPGIKNMSVTVSSNYGQSITAYCGQTTVYNYNNNYNYNINQYHPIYTPPPQSYVY